VKVAGLALSGDKAAQLPWSSLKAATADRVWSSLQNWQSLQRRLHTAQLAVPRKKVAELNNFGGMVADLAELGGMLQSWVKGT
jgi:hypothetical protein